MGIVRWYSQRDYRVEYEREYIMEDKIYETQVMSNSKVRKFIKWFDEEIGTENERNEDDESTSYVVCFDLNMEEVKKCREYENKLEKE